MTSIPVDISVTEVSMPVAPAPKTANDFPFDLRASDLLEFRIKSGQTNTFVKIASTEIRIGLPEDVLVGGSSTYTDNEEWRFRRFGDKTARFIRLAQLRYVIKGDTPARENAPYGNESSVNPIFASEKTTFIEKHSIDFAGGSISYPSTAHASGTGDFTYEFWINFDTTSGDQAIFDARSSNTSVTPVVYWNPSSSYYMYYYVSGGVRMKTTTSISAGTWYHIAIVRNSGTSTIYQDGVAEGTFSDTYNYAPYAGRLGARGQYSSAAYLFNGKMSNIRFSDNARYTANFTPSSANFTTDSNTLLLTGNSDNEGAISDLSSNSLNISGVGSVDLATDTPFGAAGSTPQSPMIALDDGSYWNSYSNGVGSNRFVKIPVSPKYDDLTVAIGKEYGSNVTAVCNAVRYEFIIKGQSGYFNRDGTETFEYVKDRGSSFRKRVDNDPSTVVADAGGGEGGGGEGGGGEGGGSGSGPVQSWSS
jgi:hypothetical protein